MTDPSLPAWTCRLLSSALSDNSLSLNTFESYERVFLDSVRDEHQCHCLQAPQWRSCDLAPSTSEK